MKKINTVSIVVMLIASLFISCNNSSPIDKDQLASLEFEQTEVSKALNATDNDDFSVNKLYWFFTAVKTDAGSQTGITSESNTHILGDAKPVCADHNDDSVSGGLGLSGHIVAPFSVGNWTFGLYAYTMADRTAEGCQLVFSTTNFKAASVLPSMISKVKVRVDAVSSENGSGKLVIKDITAGDYATTNGMIFQCKVDGITKALKGVEDFTEPAAEGSTATAVVLGEEDENVLTPVFGSWNTISSFENDTLTFEEASAGNYKVAVRIVYGSGDDELEILKSIAVTVYNGFTTIVKGSMDNLTGCVEFDYSDAPVTEYHVIYNANMAADGTAPVDSKVYKTGKKAAVLGAGTLVKTGYTFSGWNTKADGTGDSYAEGDVIAIASASVVLYAQWTQTTFTVTFDVQGRGTAPADAKADASSDWKITLPTNPTATSWSFLGWYTEPICTTKWNFDDTVSADMKLYAKWINYEFFCGDTKITDITVAGLANADKYTKGIADTTKYPVGGKIFFINEAAYGSRDDMFYVYYDEISKTPKRWSYKNGNDWEYTDLKTADGIGTGKTNTVTVLKDDNYIKLHAEEGGLATIWYWIDCLREGSDPKSTPATVIDNKGCNDWFVPSKAELKKLLLYFGWTSRDGETADRYWSLPSGADGGFFKNNLIWSSSECDSDHSWFWTYSQNQLDTADKGSYGRAYGVAVRSF